MNWNWWVARRYLLGRSRAAFSFQTSVGILSVALGVAALLLVQAVMAGFMKNLRDLMLGARPHVLISYESSFSRLQLPRWEEIQQKIETVPGVIAASPFFQRDAMATNGDEVAGIQLFGVVPKDMLRASIIGGKMREGSFLNLNGTGSTGVSEAARFAIEKRKELPGIVLGSVLAENLFVGAGDEVTIICPLCGLGPTGPTARPKKFVVVGIYRLGFSEFDSTLAFTDLATAQEFFDPGLPAEDKYVTGIQVRVDSVDQARAISGDIMRRALTDWDEPRIRARSWEESFGDLFKALALEKLGLFIVVLIIVIVASFNIAGSMIVLVREKIHDIAILKAMGATNGAVQRVFLFTGAFIGLFGTLAGLLLGLGLCWIESTFHLVPIDPAVYQMDHLPLLVRAEDVFWVIVAPVFVTTAAAFFPSLQAGRLTPAEALRNE